MLIARNTVVTLNYSVADLDGASIDQIGQALGVHRATAARWITAARDGVAERTRALLQAQLGVGASTLRQLGQLVESGLCLLYTSDAADE